MTQAERGEASCSSQLSGDIDATVGLRAVSGSLAISATPPAQVIDGLDCCASAWLSALCSLAT